ncbi:signal transduction histidine kinase [Novosphingobium sp. PhB55]|uniref:sensor histidine kinase n=1 Tax=unclassified Novosphingobium TaxID=2644732 RepID=UPI0010670D7E|nr:HAMP domain-containing sensor histidine kinase [Novosphingobium sp. PhB55]TDW64489.1 signal transduction histidine kinase [Novosphingobium sp. PhB55]
MIDKLWDQIRATVVRHWPILRLRTILLGTMVFVAALPGFGAIFLRIYENALVRRTEAELVAQGAALAASAAVVGSAIALPGARPGPPPAPPERYHDRVTEVDLRSSPILAPRPHAQPAASQPDPAAMALAGRMMPAFQQTKITTLASILILDRKGILLNGREAGGSLAALPEVRAALAGMPTTTLRENEGHPAHHALDWLSRAANIRLHHARPIVIDGKVAGVLLLSRSPRALALGIYEDRGKIALGVAAIFAMLLMLSAVLSRAIVRPIEGLSRATRALASGARISAPQPTLQVIEIRALYEDFEQMADAIEKRSRYLRDFSSSLSHEFKTPLAGISGAIELLQDHGAQMSPAESERFLANMAADARRLSRLVGRLMELARADVLIGAADAAVRPGAVLMAVADALSAEDFAIAVDLPEHETHVSIDGDALETVLTTLAENARQAGARRLDIALHPAPGVVHIDLVDDGPGIPEADHLRIFAPFFTSKRELGGTGLGLPIARSLLQAYGGELELIPSERGAHFRITCPGR